MPSQGSQGPQPGVHGGGTGGPWPCRRRGGADGHAWAVPWMDTIHHPACFFSLSLPIRVKLLTEVEMQGQSAPLQSIPHFRAVTLPQKTVLGETPHEQRTCSRISFSRKHRNLCARCRSGAGQGRRRGARRLAG